MGFTDRTTKRPALAWLAAATVALAPLASFAHGPEDPHGPGYLGVRVSEEVVRDGGGARVETVVPDSPAADAGVRDGDIIVGVDGRSVHGPKGLTTRLRDHVPGDIVTVELVRDGGVERLDVELGEPSDRIYRLFRRNGGETLRVEPESHGAWREKLRERGDGGPRRFGALSRKPLLGVRLVDLTDELRDHYGAGSDRGVLIGGVEDGSVAETAGFEVGDVVVAANGRDIGTSRDLIRFVWTHPGETVRFELVRDGRAVDVEAALPEIERGSHGRLGPAYLLPRSSGAGAYVLPSGGRGLQGDVR